MATGLVALGSNLGESRTILQRAIEALDAHSEIAVLQRSRWFVTDPVGGPEGQSQFVNGAIRLETSLSAKGLHDCLRAVESQLGRQRRQRWAARRVDLDLLLFDELVLQSESLTIPHPRMAFRRFVLQPAAEVAGDLRHPLIGWTVRQLLDHLNRAHDYVALTGPPAVGKTELARKTSQAAGVRMIEDPLGQLAPTLAAEAGDREIAVLGRRAACLTRDHWADDRGAVSDFWIGQSLAYYLASKTDREAERLEEYWREVNQHVVQPKLLVWLDVAVEQLDEPSPGPDERQAAVRDNGGIEPDRSIWREVIHRYHHGPLLQLDAKRPEWALTELTAAIQAMK